MIKRLQAYREDHVKVSSLLIRITAIFSNHYQADFDFDEIQSVAVLESGSLTADGFLCIGEDFMDRGFQVVKKAAVYDEECLLPESASHLGRDFECIHIRNETSGESIILVDPALIFIAEHLDEELNNYDAGANT